MAKLTWLASALLLFGVAYWGWSVLPETGVVVDTGLTGEADGFGTRVEFVELFIGLSVLVTAIYAGLACAARRGYTGLLNLPNKDYWFAPERRAASVRILEREFLWLLAGTNVLFASLAYDMARLTLDGRAVFGWATTVVYLVLLVLWGIRLDRRFRRH